MKGRLSPHLHARWDLYGGLVWRASPAVLMALSATLLSGQAHAWGQNGRVAAHDHAAQAHLTGEAPPARVSGAFSLVSAGAYHTCALKADDTLACWGDNTYGQDTVHQDTVHMVPFVRLTASANPLPAGQALTLTAMVMPPFNTGGVTFYDGATPLNPNGSIVFGGVATLTLPATGAGSLTPGSHALTAEYSGSESFQTASSPTLEEVVQPAGS